MVSCSSLPPDLQQTFISATGEAPDRCRTNTEQKRQNMRRAPSLSSAKPESVPAFPQIFPGNAIALGQDREKEQPDKTGKWVGCPRILKAAQYQERTGDHGLGNRKASRILPVSPMIRRMKRYSPSRQMLVTIPDVIRYLPSELKETVQPASRNWCRPLLMTS